jgi:hypothetical protein
MPALIKNLATWVALAVCASACGSKPARPVPGNLLHGKVAREVVGVEHAELISDGVTPADGDPWLTNLSATFSRADGRVVFDLGKPTKLAAALIQGDNNDTFLLAASDDGKTFRPIWTAPPVAGAGMRPRTTDALDTEARYLRVTARGGDRYVSIGELMLFSSAPEVWPPRVPHRHGRPPDVAGSRLTLLWGGALALLSLLALCRVPRAALAIGALIALGASAVWTRELIALWPIDQDLVAIVRALIAAVAIVAGLLWTLDDEAARPRVRARVPVLATVLAVLGLVGWLCFYNFGRPWFWNAAENRPTTVHTYDMRVYFPVAKYFDELAFDGVYLASVKAYLEGEKLPPRAVEHVELRDLTNNKMVSAKDVMPQIQAVSQRFSPARWAEFKEDMRFFWRTMGPGDYLGSLRDHGGNATPVWLAIANLMFRNAHANEVSLTIAGALDPLLLILTFVCIARSFGMRAMLMCLVVFGATDFPMFGSDWAGATLRFDWMCTLGMACCALKTGRPALAGVLLAHAGLARAFPVFGLLFAPLPFIWYALEKLWRARPAAAEVLPELRRTSRPMLRMTAGALVCSLLLIGLSGALFGFERSWGGWLQKIEIHTEKPNTNHVGVRTIMSFDWDLVSTKVVRGDLPEPWQAWIDTQLSTYHARRVPAALIRLAFVLLCVLACRGAPPEHAALIGTLLIPVLLYPANYYCQYVFVLPILAVGQRPWLAFWIEAVLLAMCTLEYFTLARLIDVRFYLESVILIAGFAAIVLPLAWLGWRHNEPALAAAHRGAER